MYTGNLLDCNYRLMKIKQIWLLIHLERYVSYISYPSIINSY